MSSLTDKLRNAVHDALASPRGNHLKPVRLAREVLGTANDLAGRPFCSEEELERRRNRQAKSARASAAKREPAPVLLYTDGRDQRSLRKLEGLLAARAIPYRLLDVSEDQAARSWALTQSRRDEFPLLFVAGEALGGLAEATQLDVNGELVRRVFGDVPPR